MSKQQYEVKLLGHAGERRRRAGLEFDRGVATVVELDAEQLSALESDSFFSVKPVGEAKNDENSEPSLMEQKRPVLDKMAVDLGLDPKAYKNKETLVPAIEEAQAAKSKADEGGSEDENDDDHHEEDVKLTELTVEELTVIATELGINAEELKGEDDDTTKLQLIEAIEAKNSTEE